MRRFAGKAALPAALLFLAFLGLSRYYATPVLRYDHVGPGFDVSTESFARQMEFLKAHRYRVMPLKEYARLLKAGKRVPKKSVVITFDGGFEDNFTNAYPALKKMGFSATVFLDPERIGTADYMNAEDIGIMMENKIEAGSRGSDIAGSKNQLEELLKRPVRFYSYPAGRYTEEELTAVRDAGFEGACAARQPGRHHADPYALQRLQASRSCENLIVFWLKCSGFYHWVEKKAE